MRAARLKTCGKSNRRSTVTLTRRNYKDLGEAGKGAVVAIAALEKFYKRARAPLSVDDIQLGLVEARRATGAHLSVVATGEGVTRVALRDDDDEFGVTDPDEDENAPELYTRKSNLRGRTPTQREYIKDILAHDITFGIGPAGTGKTYLAVACAVDALERDQVKRIVLTRPAVEAGERLGFLPGDLAQKVDPYLRPLYTTRSTSCSASTRR